MNWIKAQPNSCDESIQRGDTLICREFRKDKVPYKEHFYVDGNRIFTRKWLVKKNGEYEWTQRKSKGTFAKNNGPAFSFYANGTVKATTVFEHDKIVGPCKEYFQSGALQQFCQGHIHGKTHGIITHLHENGQIKAKARWENGRMMEILTYKDEQGKDLPVGTFKYGNGTWIWEEKGNPTIVYTYENGKRVKKSTLKQE